MWGSVCRLVGWFGGKILGLCLEREGVLENGCFSYETWVLVLSFYGLALADIYAFSIT